MAKAKKTVKRGFGALSKEEHKKLSAKGGKARAKKIRAAKKSAKK